MFDMKPRTHISRCGFDPGSIALRGVAGNSSGGNPFCSRRTRSAWAAAGLRYSSSICQSVSAAISRGWNRQASGFARSA